MKPSALAALALLLSFSVGGRAAEDSAPPLPPAERVQMVAGWKEELASLETELAANPKSIATLSASGDAHLFLGEYDEAVRDFQRMIKLDATQDAKHWRLGIAYYFQGQWERSTKQFVKYHEYDGHDRENGLWKFLGDAKAYGLEQARANMLPYTKFDREPFPALYDLYAGRVEPEKFWVDLEERKLTKQTQVIFFAHYYFGLHEALLGHREAARRELAAAVALYSPKTAERGGPGYMWQVARLHYEQLTVVATP